MAYTYSEELYSDLHKDARGTRPGQMGFDYWNSLLPAEKQRQWDALIVEMNQRHEEEARQEALAIERVEAQLTYWISIGAGNRETAIRWLHEAEDTNGDGDYLCFRLGLPYGYFAE